MENIFSVFEATDLTTNENYLEHIPGTGQEAVSEIMSYYSPFSIFILKGFLINDKFLPLRIEK